MLLLFLVIRGPPTRFPSSLNCENVLLASLPSPQPHPVLWPFQALELLKEIRTEGLVPNVITFTSTIEACAVAGEYTSVLLLLDEMASEGVAPSVVTFSTALK